jgi:hypothetical protein
VNDHHTPFTTTTQLNRTMAIGHRARYGHELASYYVETDHPGIQRLVRTCCTNNEESK